MAKVYDARDSWNVDLYSRDAHDTRRCRDGEATQTMFDKKENKRERCRNTIANYITSTREHCDGGLPLYQHNITVSTTVKDIQVTQRPVEIGFPKRNKWIFAGKNFLCPYIILVLPTFSPFFCSYQHFFYHNNFIYS
jgi:hypothetical protein